MIYLSYNCLFRSPISLVQIGQQVQDKKCYAFFGEKMIEYDSIDVTPSTFLNYGSAALSSIEILSTAMSIQSASESHSINVATNIVLGSILLLANRVSGPIFQVLLKVKLGSLFLSFSVQADRFS